MQVHNYNDMAKICTACFISNLLLNVPNGMHKTFFYFQKFTFNIVAFVAPPSDTVSQFACSW